MTPYPQPHRALGDAEFMGARTGSLLPVHFFQQAAMAVLLFKLVDF